MICRKKIYVFLWLLLWSSLLCPTLFSQEKKKSKAGKEILVKKDGALFIHYAGKDLLGFQYEMHYPPAGVDTAFKRNGYIHPVYTPHGQLLTRINAPDHYHHYGIWNPWTKIQYMGNIYDLWNLVSRQGTVRFEKFNAIIERKNSSSFSARLNHIAFIGNQNEKKETIIIVENQKITFHHPAREKDHYFLDVEIELIPATDSAVILKEYRYGGLGWRATEEWHKDNSAVLTSAGLARKEADGSLARWVVVEGSLGNERGGMVWFSHPGNYNHPEPLRIWPEDSNKRGDMFANFSPTKNKDWILEPHKKYKLKYRILVYNGTMMDKIKMDKLWDDFSINKINLDLN
jgi:hypothetical protein